MALGSRTTWPLLVALSVTAVLLLVEPSSAALSAKAAKYQACFSVLMQSAPPDFNATEISGPSPGTLSDDVAELMSKDLTDQVVDDFCASLNAPEFLNKFKGSSGASAVVDEVLAAAATGTAKGSSDDNIVHAAVASDNTRFETAYTRLSNKDNLYQPHDAEYQGFASYGLAIEQLRALGVHSGDYRDRTYPYGRASNLVVCKIVTFIIPITHSSCEVADSQPGSIPVPPACIPNPGKIAGKLCWIAYALLKATEYFCNDNFYQIYYVDRTLNGMQTLATHENLKKTMDNQQILWKRIDKGYDDLSAALKQRFTSMLQRQCKLENDIAFLQREVNYLRKLLLTPDTLKPGFACFASAKTAVMTNQSNVCITQCALTQPSGCTSFSLQSTIIPQQSGYPTSSTSCRAGNAR